MLSFSTKNEQFLRLVEVFKEGRGSKEWQLRKKEEIYEDLSITELESWRCPMKKPERMEVRKKG